MASTIAAVITGGGGVVTTADASGNLNLLAGTTTVVSLTTAGATVPGTLGVTGVATLGNGAILGTPASLVGTNITGTASGLTAGNVTTNANLTGGVTSVGNAATVITNANLTGGVTSVGNATTVVTNANLTGGVTSVGNATTVVTNANLTGPITSVGNATAIAAQTGTGSTFVMQASPTLTTPNIGTPSAGVVTNLTGTASININGTVGATTPAAGAFTTLSASSTLAVGASVTGALSQFESSSLKQIKITYSSVASYFLNTNASGNLTIDKDGSLLGTFSSTGLAVTGTLSATGALTAPSSYSWTAANTPIVVGLSALNYNSSGIYSKYSFNAYHNGTNDIYMSGSGYGATQILSYSSGSGNLKIQTAVGGTGTITWVDTAVFSPTGLAITGTLSNTTGANFATSSGNIGIGTTTPNGMKLVVLGATGYPAVTGTTQTGVLRLTGGTGLYNVLDMGVNESTDTAWIQATRANSLGTYDKLVINPYGGNVGIGTTSPTTLFRVAGTTNQASSMSSTSGTDAAMAEALSEIRQCSFNVANSSNFVISNIVTSSTGWRAVFRGTWSNNYEGGGLTPPPPHVEVNAANPSIIVGSRTLTVSRNGSGYLMVNSADAYNIAFTGVVEIYQNPQGNQSNRSMQLLGGITFPATQSASSDANTLDDYEEGTWTPYLSSDSTGAFTMSTQFGRYTKVGNMVTVICYAAWSSRTSGGNVAFYGYPFNINNFTGGGLGATTFIVKSATDAVLTNTTLGYDGNGISGTTYIYNYARSGLIQVNSLSSAGFLAFTGTYFV